MKKNLFLTFCLMLTVAMAPNAYAIQMMWDVAAAGAPAFGDANTTTGVFDEFGFASQTSTIQYDADASGDVSVGDNFVDSGNLRMTSLLASGFVDTEGLWAGGNYEVTGNWDNVTGNVTAVTPGATGTQLDVKYTGGNINFYLDTNLNSMFADPGNTTPDSGAGGTGFADGTLIGSFTVVDGIGHTFVDFTGNALASQGSVELYLQANDLLDGFWLNAAGVDIKTIFPMDWIFAYTDMNINTPNFADGVPAGALYTAYSNQNGSGSITIVPEPATVLLLGAGLAGLGLLGYRRKS